MSDLITRTTMLLRQASIDAAQLSVHELGSGGNNRVYRVQCAGGRFALKHYFSHPGDRRDRLGAETGILRYLEHAGVGALPKCIYANARQSLALFTWVDGVRPRTVTSAHVRAAGQLFSEMNRGRAITTELGSASDASFSIAEALESVERRLASLMHVSRKPGADRVAAELVDEMTRLWPALKDRTYRQALQAGLDPDEEIRADERCLSPSDFGFHNVIETASGQLVFVDFEYAGWDDPAKMAADFFCQPEVPVSLRYWDEFIDTAFAYLDGPARIAARAQVLLPAFQLRWCAIVLNLFLPVSLARRQFSRAHFEEDHHKRRQLRIAQSMFSQVAA